MERKKKYESDSPAGVPVSDFDAKSVGWDLQSSRRARAGTIAQAILPVCGDLPRGPALDFGCGTGLLGMEFVSRGWPVTFADSSRGMLEQVRAKIGEALITTSRTLDLQSEPLGTGYRLVMSLMTLHHIPHLERQIHQLVLATAPGGLLALSDLDVEDGSFHGEEVVPHNGIDRGLLSRYLEEAGATVFSSTTPWIQTKDVAGRERSYPVFLLMARKR